MGIRRFVIKWKDKIYWWKQEFSLPKINFSRIRNKFHIKKKIIYYLYKHDDELIDKFKIYKNAEKKMSKLDKDRWSSKYWIMRVVERKSNE